MQQVNILTGKLVVFLVSLFFSMPVLAIDCPSGNLDPKSLDYSTLVACINEMKDQPSIPSGAVLASTKECDELGEDWSRFDQAEGRFIVGVGASSDRNGETANFPLGEKNGEFRHKLEPAEMPSHVHALDAAPTRLGPAKHLPGLDIPNAQQSGSNGWYGVYEVPQLTRPSEGGTPHNNMPPYVALYFCRKN